MERTSRGQRRAVEEIEKRVKMVRFVRFRNFVIRFWSSSSWALERPFASFSPQYN